MKSFKNATTHVNFSMEDLKFHNLSETGSKVTTCKSKSEMFKLMYDAGMEVCEISRETGSHYSFVWGVISNAREMRVSTKVTASDEIRKLHDEGKKPGEIAKLLNKNYSFVFGVVKKYKASKTAEAVAPKVDEKPIIEKVEVKEQPKQQQKKQKQA